MPAFLKIWYPNQSMGNSSQSFSITHGSIRKGQFLVIQLNLLNKLRCRTFCLISMWRCYQVNCRFLITTITCLQSLIHVQSDYCSMKLLTFKELKTQIFALSFSAVTNKVLFMKSSCQIIFQILTHLSVRCFSSTVQFCMNSSPPNYEPPHIHASAPYHFLE
jgi:hypothetical protein